MNVQLKSEHARFIEEQVRQGHYPSIETAVESAIDLMIAQADLDEETLAAIERSEIESDQGKSIPWEVAEAELRRRFLSK